jgi:hypothetical protein
MVLNQLLDNISVGKTDLKWVLCGDLFKEKIKLREYMKRIQNCLDVSLFKSVIRILPNPRSSGIIPNYFWTRNGLRKNKIKKIWKIDGIV